MQVSKEYKVLTKSTPPKLATYEGIVSEGLPITAVSNMMMLFGGTKKQVAGILHLSVRRIDQISRVKARKVSGKIVYETITQKTSDDSPKGLNKNSTERAFMVTHAFLQAVEYFGSEDKAREWFHRKNMSLGDRAPIELCETLLGIRRIENTIGKLKYGMTA